MPGPPKGPALVTNRAAVLPAEVTTAGRSGSDDSSYGFGDDDRASTANVAAPAASDPLTRPQDTMLAFKEYTVALGGKALVKGAIGYIRKGGLTAVLGPSASGKSVLLQSLAGHSDALAGALVSGEVYIDGRPAAAGAGTRVAFVPQSNGHLVGVLTVRECLEYSLRLRRPRMPAVEREARVSDTLVNLGLDVCQHTQIGTIYKRGISGGQQRRVAVGVELVYRPDVVMIDECTSGLDTTTALATVRYLRELLAAKGGTSGMMLSIHQPNDDLLSLFDDVVMVTNGGCIFSGVLSSARAHLTDLAPGIDLASLPGVPVTETFLRVADTTFPKTEAGAVMTNFPAAFAESADHAALSRLVVPYTGGGGGGGGDVAAGEDGAPPSIGDHVAKFATLFRRLVTISKRDLTLYHVQYFLQGQYGFMIGALFFQRSHTIGNATFEMINACLWVSSLLLYVFVFKSYYNAENFKVVAHEQQNHMYGPVSNALAELSVLLLAVPGYIPSVAICYFMVGFPASTFPFVVIFAFVASFAGEAIPTVVAQFTRGDASKALMSTQGVLLIFFIFAGGIFIRDGEIPSYWQWLQQISIFEHGVKATTANAFTDLEFGCPGPYTQSGVALGYQPAVQTGGHGSCVTLEATFPCDALDTGAATGDGCKVQGLTVVRVLKQYEPDRWQSLLYLFLIGLALRVTAVFLQFFSPSTLLARMLSWRWAASNRRARDAPLREWFAGGVVPLTDAVVHHEGASKPPVLAFRNIGVRISKKILVKPKVIIEDISGVVRGGRLCALMGPSGSGKTTLLNALSGRALYAEIEGAIMINGEELTKKHFAYVPQVDSINPFFTVTETLTNAARLRCDENRGSIVRRVGDLIEIVGLVPVAGVRAGKLTGGQLKLLSVAVGLVQSPTVLFLDEPSTGLDSTSASAVMEHLAVIARTGVVTLLTVHQPSKSVFNLVDDVLLLGSDGSLAFSGSKADAIKHFSAPPLSVVFPPEVNPADVLIDAVTTTSRDGAVDDADAAELKPVTSAQPRRNSSDIFRESAFNAQLSEMLLREESDGATAGGGGDTTTPVPSFATRVAVLVGKIFRHYLRDPGAYFYMLVVVSFFGVFLGTLFFDLPKRTENLREVLAAVFLAIWMALYFSLISIPTNCKARNEAVQMVASSHCTPLEWCLAQFIAQMPFSFAASIILAAFFHFLCNINPTVVAFVWMTLNLWLLHMTFAAVAWNLIETLVNPMLVTTASMAVLGTFFLFAGFFILQEEMVPVLNWIPWTVPTKYSLSGTEYVYFHGVDYVDSSSGTEVTISGDDIVDSEFNVSYDSFARAWLDLVIIAAFLVAFRAQHLALFWKHTKDFGVTIRGQRGCWEKDVCRDVCGC